MKTNENSFHAGYNGCQNVSLISAVLILLAPPMHLSWDHDQGVAIFRQQVEETEELEAVLP